MTVGRERADLLQDTNKPYQMVIPQEKWVRIYSWIGVLESIDIACDFEPGILYEERSLTRISERFYEAGYEANGEKPVIVGMSQKELWRMMEILDGLTDEDLITMVYGLFSEAVAREEEGAAGWEY